MKRAVILAGGKGTRLAPYTTVFPKPLMPLGDTPVLEVVLRQLAGCGFGRVTLAVGYLAELLEAFFGDGGRLGLEIDYVRETTPLGTAGPLGAVRDLTEPFLVVNGDILTTLDYGEFLEAHRLSGAIASIATYTRVERLEFGIIQTDIAGHVTGYLEKPTYEHTVSMGVNAFSPEVLGYVSPDRYLDIPDLIRGLLHDGHAVRSAPFDGYWLDIGRHDDFARAQEEFASRKAEFLGDEA